MPPVDPAIPHPRIAFLLDELAGARRALTAVLADASDAALAVAPPSGGWSGLEVLDHLAKMEDGVSRMVRKLVREGLAAGLADESETEVASIVATLAPFRIAEGDRPVEAPAFVRPGPQLERVTVEAALVEARGRFEEWLHAGSGKALGTLGWPHPIFGHLSIYQWAYLTAQHERRHTAQLVRALG